MERLIQIAIEEVGLEGEKGSTVERLWNRIQDRLEQSTTFTVHDVTVQFDQDYKSYFWTLLGQVDELEFQSNNKDISKSISLQEAMSMSDFRILASKSIRDALILTGGMTTLSSTCYDIVSLIASKREQGITQNDIAKVLNLDSRSMFHFLNQILKSELIHKFPVNGQGITTNLCIHRRFLDGYQKKQAHLLGRMEGDLEDGLIDLENSNLEQTDIIKQKMSLLVEQAMNQIMVADDLMTALNVESMNKANGRRWVNKLLQQMVSDGYFEKVLVKKATGKGTDRCMRLLKPYIPIAKETKKSTKNIVDLEADLVLGEGGALCDLPLDLQIPRLLSTVPTQGAVSGTLWRSMSRIGSKVADRLVAKLLKPSKGSPLIRKETEMFGKARRHRYFLIGGKSQAIKATSKKTSVKSKKKDAFVVESDDEKMSASPKPVTTTAVKRREALIRLLEIKKAMELTAPLGILIAEEMQRHGETVLHNIDKKTINKDAAALEAEGKLKISKVMVPMVEGHTNSKILLLHPETNMDDMEVEICMEEIRDRNFYGRSTMKPSEATVDDDIQVERLDDMKKRLVSQSNFESDIPVFRGDMDAPVSEAYLPDVVVPDQSITSVMTDKVISTIIQSESTPVKSAPLTLMAWLPVAEHYGWINAKMVRARILHEHLIQYCQSTTSTLRGPYKNGGLFTTATVIREMPLCVFLKVVGVISSSSLLDEFLALPGNDATLMHHLSPGLIKELESSKPRSRKYIQQALSILEALQLIKSASTDNLDDETFGKIRKHYKLMRHVPLLNYGLPQRPLVQYMTIESVVDHEEFWARLEILSFSKKYGIPTTIDVPAEDFSEETFKDAEYFFKNISVARNWHIPFKYTSDQKSILEAYVDRMTGTTPASNPEICLNLSKILNISVVQIKTYFQRIEYHHRYSRKKRDLNDQLKQKAKEKGQQPQLQEEAEHINEAVREAVKKTIHKRRTLHETETVFVSGKNAQQVAKNVIRRRKKHFWTDEEDQKVIAAHVLLSKTRCTNGSKMTWAPIAKCFANKTGDACRRRHQNVHQRNAAHILTAQTLGRSLEQYMKLNPQDPLIDKFKSANLDTLDLSEYISFMLESIAHLPIENQHVDQFPETYEAFERDYETKNHVFLKIEDQIEDTKPAQNLVRLLETTLVMNTIVEKSIRKPETEIDRIKSLIKMVLAIPEELYDPMKAHLAFSYFHNDIIERALNQLREEGLVNAVWRTECRPRLPGRPYQLSEKFLQNLKSSMPVGVMDPKKPLLHISSFTAFDAASDSATVAMLIDHLCNGRIKMKADPLTVEIELSTREDGNRVKIGLHISPILKRRASIQEPKRKKIRHETLRLIENEILHSGKDGIFKQDLMERLEKQGIEPDVAEEGLRNLPDIRKVGITDVRFVSAEHSADYLIRQGKNKPILDGRIWSSLEGCRVDPVFHTCLEAVLSIIWATPGIAEVKLYEKLDIALTRVEVDDLLEHLIVKNVIERRLVATLLPSHSVFEDGQVLLNPYLFPLLDGLTQLKMSEVEE